MLWKCSYLYCILPVHPLLWFCYTMFLHKWLAFSPIIEKSNIVDTYRNKFLYKILCSLVYSMKSKQNIVIKKNWPVHQSLKTGEWRYSQSCWHFDPAVWTVAPLTLSRVQPFPPHPFPVWIYTYTVCKGGGVWGSGPQTDKHLPQSPFTCRYL